MDETGGQARVRVVIELDAATEPLAGRVVGSDGEVHRFDGYIQLMALLATASWAADKNGGLSC